MSNLQDEIWKEEASVLIKQGLLRCKKCGTVKSVDQFSENKLNKLGYSYACKKCKAQHTQYYNKLNPQKKKERDAIYYQKHRQECLLRVSKWGQTEKGKCLHKEANKRYRKTEKGRLFMREQNIKRKDEKKQWQLDNKERINDLTAIRRQTDLNFKIKCNLRTRVSMAIRLNNAIKQSSLDEYLGCSIEYFKHYIEELFDENMSWDNYGKYGWHIDHIIPCDAFDLTTIEQQKECFHYTNLQPLWWQDNLRKGNRVA